MNNPFVQPFLRNNYGMNTILNKHFMHIDSQDIYRTIEWIRVKRDDSSWEEYIVYSKLDKPEAKYARRFDNFMNKFIAVE